MGPAISKLCKQNELLGGGWQQRQLDRRRPTKAVACLSTQLFPKCRDYPRPRWHRSQPGEVVRQTQAWEGPSGPLLRACRTQTPQETACELQSSPADSPQVQTHTREWRSCHRKPCPRSRVHSDIQSLRSLVLALRFASPQHAQQGSSRCPSSTRCTCSNPYHLLQCHHLPANCLNYQNCCCETNREPNLLTLGTVAF